MKTNTNQSAVTILFRLTIAVVILAIGFGLPMSLSASERWETLEAIHLIENPNNTARPGRCGELGAYQFRESTWRMHTSVPFAMAIDRRVSDGVAICHYEWLKQGLTRNGLGATPYNIALAWNGGLTAAIRGSVRPVTRDYAERVANIALEIRKAQVASNR